MPPPPLSAATPEAVFCEIVVPLMVIVPDPFHKPPPSAAAVLEVTFPPVMVAIPAPVMCNPPPFPGAAKAGVRPALLEVILTFERITFVPATLSMAPPARLARLSESVLFETERLAWVQR